MTIGTKKLGLACLLLALLTSSCEKARAQESTFPTTVVFDDSLHRFYAYGRRVRSPAVLGFESGKLIVNGFRGAPVVKDTTGREAGAARLYRNVPYIQRRHADGLTYEQASHEFYDAVYRSVERAMAEYKRAEQVGDSNPVRRARMVLDTTVIDATAEFSIRDGTVEVTERGLGPEYFLNVGMVPTKTPTPVERAAVLQSDEAERAKWIRGTLLGRSASLTIISQKGPSMDVRGDPLIKECFAVIDEAIRSRRAKDGHIPKGILEEIIAENAP